MRNGNEVFWLLDQMARQYFKFYYKPGQENLTDYPTKHNSSAIHKHVRPYYVQMDKSPLELLRASKPNLGRGCTEILWEPYLQQVPLTQIPDYQKPSLGSKPLTRTPNYCVANTPRSNPRLSVQPHGKTIISDVSQRTSDIAFARLQQRIRVIHVLADILAQYT